MSNLKRKTTHTVTFCGEEYELVFDMRAKSLMAKLAHANDVDADDPIGQMCVMFVACVNSALIRSGKKTDLLDINEILESDWEIAELKTVMEEVTKSAYEMENDGKDKNDLYADEVADNEKNRVTGVN